MSLRVLLLSWRDKDHPEAGGAEAFLENVSRELQARGHDVTVFTARVRRRRRRIPRPTAGPSSAAAAGTPSTCHGLLHLLRHGGRYDVVVDVQNGVPFWAPLVARQPVVNVVHHVHRELWPEVFGPVRARFGWWLESWLAPRVYRRSRYVVVSRSTRDELVGLGVEPGAVTVVYSGREPSPALEHIPRTPCPSLVVLGRLVPHKRVELALRAVAELRARHPGLHLTVVGHGYWQEALHAEVARLGIEDAVTFTGFASDELKHRVLAESWLNLLPSLKEGWGLAIVEAGAHGTPSVAFTSAGGTTESVLDGKTGRLVDDDDDFLSTVSELIDDTTARAALGSAAREHAAGFTWESTADYVEAVLLAANARDWSGDLTAYLASTEDAAGQLAS